MMLKTKAKDPTDAVFGIANDGTVFHYTLSAGPHWLLCGQTGSGKSVYANSLLVSCISHAHPDELKIIWVDPKKVEAAAYVDLPHCPINPITDMNDAYGLLMYMTHLMDARYEQFEATNGKVKNIHEWNELMEEQGTPEKKMPWIIVVIDEYADLVMQVKNVEAPIQRLGQKARACGTHLLIATQRPSADVIKPTIRSNVPGRIGLRVASAVDSQIIIDEAGAESLAGYGDSIIKLAMGEKFRVQGPYISNGEIDEVFAYVRDNYDREVWDDWKQVCVDENLCKWAETYDDDVPMSERHLAPISAW